MTHLDNSSVGSNFKSHLNEFGIFEVVWTADFSEISLAHIKLIRSKLKKFGGGKKVPLYVESSEFVPLSAEARKYIATEESSNYTLANAVKIDTLPKKILFNFLLRFFNPLVPTKAFTTKEEAFKWLIELKKDYEKSTK